MARSLNVSVVASQASKHQTVAKPTSAKSLSQSAGRLAAVLLANASAAKLALADDLSLPEINIPDVNLPNVDVSAITSGGFTDFLAENALIIGGGAAFLAIPLGLNALLSGGGDKGAKAVTPEQALQALGEDSRVVLVDIRSKEEIKAEGTPDLRPVKRKSVSLPFTKTVKGEVVIDETFVDRFGNLPGLDEDSLVILLASEPAAAKAAAKAVASEYEVQKLYTVDSESWAETAPWRAPGKGLSLSIPSIDLKNIGGGINTLAEDFKEAPTLTKAGLAAGAIAGAGVILFNEAEVILELAGLVAVGQFLLKLVFADEREKTLSEIREVVNEKVAIQEVGEDLNKIATALLEEVPADATPKAAAAAVEEPVAAVSAGNGNGASEEDNVKEAREWIESWKSKSAA